MSITITTQDDTELYSVINVIGESGSSTTIPILSKEQQPTSDYTKALEKAINSDGCTDVPEFHHDCCVFHDLAYRFGIDIYGNSVTRAQADHNFRICMEKEDPLGRFSPLAWWRWAGVRIFGRFFYQGTALKR